MNGTKYALNWETLLESELFRLRRAGRYLTATLNGEHDVISTSIRNGGQTATIRVLANHQSCEGARHLERHERISQQGQLAYHDSVCAEMSLAPEEVALMGTAANMNYAAVQTCRDASLEVTAVVTAGVHGNAACAGDKAHWREGEKGWVKVDGTINTILLINQTLTPAALARSVVTMTEAKTAALRRLAVRSLQGSELATGTGTDQFAIGAPRFERQVLTSASTHVKLGELIGVSVRDATLEALRWQNGLEPSYTRSIFAALARFGLAETTFLEQISPYLSERQRELLSDNHKSVVYEPLVGACAFAIAAVLDRVRFGTLPNSVAQEVVRQQASTMAANVAAQSWRWAEFHEQLQEDEPMKLVLRAIALGWAAKWE